MFNPFKRNEVTVKKVWFPLMEHLWARVLLGLVLGACLGVLFGPDLKFIAKESSENLATWVAFPGHFFLACIQMIVIPLILASVVCGIAAGENLSNVKTLGAKIVFYFLLTTTVSVSIGVLLSSSFNIGGNLDQNLMHSARMLQEEPIVNEALTGKISIPERVVALIPRNPFQAFSAGEMLQIVLFAAVLGAALLGMKKERARPLLELASSTQEACMVVVGWVLILAPFAVFGLIFELTAKMGVSAVISMAGYMLTVIGGLVGVVLFYLVILSFIAKRSPLEFLSQIREAQLIAFSTSSSSATMPVTLRVAEQNLKIRPDIARFVIPLGTTINMDGTALYQTIATVFLAQAFGVDLGIVEIIAILTTAVAASIGTPGTPGVGIVVLASILVTVGVPAEGIAIIIGVDRILDMCRTTVNVTGDLVAASVMERWVKK